MHRAFSNASAITSPRAGRVRLLTGDTRSPRAMNRYSAGFRVKEEVNVRLAFFDDECAAVCGDGILRFGTECDEGMNDGSYDESVSSWGLGSSNRNRMSTLRKTATVAAEVVRGALPVAFSEYTHLWVRYPGPAFQDTGLHPLRTHPEG